jgi:hypothetical protein
MLPFATLDPGLTDIAYTAYDAAWNELKRAGHEAGVHHNDQVVRRRVTDTLVRAMRGGEHNPDRLKAIALAAIMWAR